MRVKQLAVVSSDILECRGAAMSRPAGPGYCRYVGRVGALAVALGVGAAVASMPAVALADTTGSSGSSSSTSSSAGSSSSSSSRGAGASPSSSDPGSSESGGSPAGSSSDASSDVDAADIDAADLADNTDDDDEASSDVDVADIDGADFDGADFDGADIDDADIEDADIDDADGDLADVVATDLDGSDGDVAGIDVVDGEVSGSGDGASGLASSMSDEGAVSTAEVSIGGPSVVPAAVAETGDLDSDVGLDAPVAGLGLATLGFASRREASSGGSPGEAGVSAVGYGGEPAGYSAAIDGVTRPVPAALAAAESSDGPSYPDAVTAPVTWRSMVTEALTWNGLGALASYFPLSDDRVPDLIAGLWVGVRKFRYTFFNAAPTLAPTVGDPDPYTGIVDGHLGAADADGDVLSYTVTTAPTNGQLLIHDDGTYTYIPNADIAATGGADTFTVAVTDQNDANPTHYHPLRLSDFLRVSTTRGAAAATRIAAAAARTTASPTVTNDRDGSSATIDLTVAPVTDASGYGFESYSAVGDYPTRVAVSPDGGTTYVTNLFGQALSVIDNATSTVTDTVDVGNLPTGVAVSPDGSTVYVANSGDNTVWAIDTASNEFLAAYKTGSQPQSVAVSPDNTTVYVANSGDDTMHVIDTVNNGLVEIPAGSAPWGVAVSPDGSTVYVTNTRDDTVSMIDPVSYSSLPIDVGQGRQPTGIAISPDGATIYVANQGDNTMTAIDLATLGKVGFDTGGSPTGIAVSPDGDTVYVTNRGGNSVSVINPTTYATSSLAATISEPWGIAVSGDGKNLYIAESGSNNLVSVAVSSDSVAGAIGPSDDFTGQGRPLAAVFSPDGSTAYIAQQIGGDVLVVDVATSDITGTIDANFSWDDEMAISPDGTTLYIPNANSWENPFLNVVDIGTNKIVTSIPLANYLDVGDPNGVAVSPDGAYVYAGNTADSSVSVIDTTTNKIVTKIWQKDYTLPGNPPIPVDPFPVGVTVSPDGETLFVSIDDGLGGADIGVYDVTDPTTPLSKGTFDAPGNITGVAVTPDGETMYISSKGNSDAFGPVIWVVDLTTVDEDFDPIAITPNASPFSMALSPDGTTAYFANTEDDSVSVLDTATNTFTTTITGVGSKPTQVAVSPDGANVYVLVDGKVTVINTGSLDS